MVSNFRLNMLSALGAVALSALESAPAFDIEPSKGEPNRSVNRKSGSQPVPGGGAKERAKRLKRLQQKPQKGGKET